jgi:hypothetical protein
MLAKYTYVFGFAFLALTVALAWWRGGRLEKEVAAALAGAWIASALVPVGDRLGPSIWIVAIDIVVALYFLYRAAFSKGLWIMVVAAFQLLVLATHCACAVREPMEQWGYFTAYYLWSWGELAAICVGSLRTRRPRI